MICEVNKYFHLTVSLNKLYMLGDFLGEGNPEKVNFFVKRTRIIINSSFSINKNQNLMMIYAQFA